jgi:hypothetical protein
MGRRQLVRIVLRRRVSVSRMLEICMSGSTRGSGFIPAPYSTVPFVFSARQVTLICLADCEVSAM